MYLYEITDSGVNITEIESTNLLKFLIKYELI